MSEWQPIETEKKKSDVITETKSVNFSQPIKFTELPQEEQDRLLKLIEGKWPS